MRIGVLTGGGDCPGINAVIRAIVLKASGMDADVVGIGDGWAGLLGEAKTVPLDSAAVADILPRGGTILGTSRTNPLKRDGGIEEVLKNLSRLGIDALIAIGGDDTQSVANGLYKRGGKVVGVPKTIDNDLSATDRTFGFSTAVQIATEAIDRLHTTAESHHRSIVVEVMGRHAGWIAMHAGIAGGADYILIPEVPFDIDDVCATVKRGSENRGFSIVVTAEGAKPEGAVVTKQGVRDEFGHVLLGGVADRLARDIEQRTGVETRAVILGHTQRGGSPTAYDRVLATRFGEGAVGLVEKGQWGQMVALRGTDIVSVSLADAIRESKTVDPAFYEMAKAFFG